MERRRDLRRAAANGLPRRRQRITTLRDSSTDEVELQETVRLRDREKKDHREIPKRRRVDRPSAVQQRSNESVDSSDDDEEEEHYKATNNRRGLRTLRSAPVLRTAVDEMLGVPVPRRVRSSKRLHEYGDSPARRVGSSSSSGDLTRKKMKSVVAARSTQNWSGAASNSKPCSAIPNDDIEIEVAEALFDLMKQSQSSRKRETVDRDRSSANTENNDELKAENDKDEKELRQEERIEKEKICNEAAAAAQELVSGDGDGVGDGFVNKGKVGFPKESESPSRALVNADNASVAVEAKENKLDIDLMAPPPPLTSSPEKDALADIASDRKVITQDVQKKSETISKDGPLTVATQIQEENIRAGSSNQFPIDLEKGGHVISSVSENTIIHRQERKNQLPTSLLPFPSWTGVLPPGYMQSFMPIDGSARSSMTTQPPFKFSHPRPRRCATHQCIAQNIHNHQQLMNESLSAAQTGLATSYGTKSLNLKSMLPPKKFLPGNPLLGNFQGGPNLAAISGVNGKDKSSVLQKAPNQAPPNTFLHAPGFLFPFDHNQTTMIAPANSSGPPESSSAVGNTSLRSNLAGRLSVNFPLPGQPSSAMSFNHPRLPSNEAASYMAMLQNNGYPLPISPNIALPDFKGALFGSRMHSPSLLNVAQNTSIVGGSKISDYNFPKKVTDLPLPDNKLLQLTHSSSKSDPEISRNKQSDPQQGSKGRAELIPQAFAWSSGSNSSTSPALNFSSMQNTPIYQMPLVDMSKISNQISHQKDFQASEGKKSLTFRKSDDTSALSMMGNSVFDGLDRTINFRPSGNKPFQSPFQQLIQSQKPPHTRQMQLEGTAQVKNNSIFGGSVFPSNHPPVFTQASIQTDNSPFPLKRENFSRAPEGSSSQPAMSALVNIPQPKSSQGQEIVIKSRPVSLPANSSLSKNSGNSQRTSPTVSALPSQETDASPACRRNVPSILSTRPAQLPELKY